MINRIFIIKTASLLLTATIMLSTLLGGVCVSKKPLGSRQGRDACILTMDFCGQEAGPLSQESPDTLCSQPCAPTYYYPVISFVPPRPALAAASAEPGETDKPPKA